MSCVCVSYNKEGMERLDALLRHISFVVPELPYDLALDMLRQAYIEFAKSSTILIAEYDLYFQKGVRDYTLEAPEGYRVFAIKNSQYRDSINPAHFYYPNPNRWYYAYGNRYYIRSDNEIVFRDAPSSDAKKPHRLHLAVIPDSCVDYIPTEISVPYGRGIALKVIADALNIPNRPWTNPALAQKYERDFHRTVMDAKNLALTNRGALAPMFRPVRIL